MNNESGKNKPLGFKDYVKNPDLFKQLPSSNGDLEIPMDLSEDELWGLVEKLISDDSDVELELLEQLGDVAVPQLVKARGDKRFHEIQKSSRGMPPGHFIERSPIEAVSTGQII